MSNDLLITPGSRKQEFKDSSGNIDAKIETDSSGNLVITNPGGDISIGDTSADIFIGDGSSNVDIVFEQNGEIRGTSGVTITLGASDSNVRMATDLNLNSNNITGVADLTITGDLNITGNINSYNVTDLDVTDKTITVAAGAANSTAADGAGLIVDGANAKLTWDNGDSRWSMNKSLQFDDTATVTNQNLGVFWTAFDKEGTTDFSDTAYIRHTVNVGGITNSCLEIKSANDAGDGIAFTTHSSSRLKHNSNIVITQADIDGENSESAQTSSTTSNRTYKVQKDSNNKLVVNVPWSDTNTVYTLPLATSGARGGVKIGYSENGKNYPVELSNEQMYVNVPWTDTNTNTTYSALSGGGLALTSTSFKLNGSEIAGSVDLDTMRTTGIFPQNANADATSGSNYPQDLAGILEVINPNEFAGGNNLHTLQRYSIYNSTKVWHRYYYNGTWSSWKDLSADTNTTYSTATNSTLGLVKIGYSENGKNYPVELSSGQMYVNVPWTDTNTTYSTATNSTLGLVKIGYTENGKNYPVELSSGQMFVNVPWTDTDTNTTYSTATNSTLGLIKIGYTENGKNYPVELSNGQAFVNVPWTDTDTNTTYSTATNSTLGLVKIGYSENGKNYPVELSNGQMYVNVPWTDTDTNTTYSTATNSTLGLVKIGYSENGKNYPVELSSGQMFVNVPWTDTDTNTWQANTATQVGYVASPASAANKAWQTDGSGNPGWQTPLSAFGSATVSTSGTVRASKFESDSDGDTYIHFPNTDQVDIYAGGVTLARFVESGSGADFISFFGSDNTGEVFFDANGNIHADANITAYSTTTNSDKRLKENIRPLENCLDKVLGLDGVIFDWKKETRGKNQVGFIAQQVEEHAPELVGTSNDNDIGEIKTVNYEGAIPMLVEALKEQQSIINRLESRIKDLENKG